MGALQGEDCFLSLLGLESAHPVPTMVFLKLSLDMVMPSAPFGCTHPPTLPTLSAHTEPISKGRCWKWHHKLKFSCPEISDYVCETANYHNITSL